MCWQNNIFIWDSGGQCVEWGWLPAKSPLLVLCLNLSSWAWLDSSEPCSKINSTAPFLTYDPRMNCNKMKYRIPGVYVALTNSHFGTQAKTETEHLKKKHKTLLRGEKKIPQVKFNERQKLKSFLNQFSLSQHNIITKCFPTSGLCDCPDRGTEDGEQRWARQAPKKLFFFNWTHRKSSFLTYPADIKIPFPLTYREDG